MHQLAHFITRHRRLLLAALMSVTLLVSSEANRLRLAEESTATALPVASTAASDSVAAFSAQQTDQHARDVAALTALINRKDVDDRTREDAATQLNAMVADREARFALEEILCNTSLAPCSAVVAGGSVTIVTAKTDITAEESAMVIALAAAHCGTTPENVRILSTE